MKLMSILAGIKAAFSALFVVSEAQPDVVLYPNSESERYLRLYRVNRSAPYFNESDPDSGDGLVI